MWCSLRVLLLMSEMMVAMMIEMTIEMMMMSERVIVRVIESVRESLQHCRLPRTLMESNDHCHSCPEMVLSSCSTEHKTPSHWWPSSCGNTMKTRWQSIQRNAGRILCIFHHQNKTEEWNVDDNFIVYLQLQDYDLQQALANHNISSNTEHSLEQKV